MDNKELQKTVNPAYLTAKSTLGLLKKAGNWILAAILVFGAMTVLTSCSNDDKVVELDQEGYAGMPLIILYTTLTSVDCCLPSRML